MGRICRHSLNRRSHPNTCRTADKRHAPSSMEQSSAVTWARQCASCVAPGLKRADIANAWACMVQRLSGSASTATIARSRPLVEAPALDAASERRAGVGVRPCARLRTAGRAHDAYDVPIRDADASPQQGPVESLPEDRTEVNVLTCSPTHQYAPVHRPARYSRQPGHSCAVATSVLATRHRCRTASHVPWRTPRSHRRPSHCCSPHRRSRRRPYRPPGHSCRSGLPWLCRR